jgi:hypothetical protein
MEVLERHGNHLDFRHYLPYHARMIAVPLSHLHYSEGRAMSERPKIFFGLAEVRLSARKSRVLALCVGLPEARRGHSNSVIGL